jgi:hypothetical protein
MAAESLESIVSAMPSCAYRDVLYVDGLVKSVRRDIRLRMVIAAARPLGIPVSAAHRAIGEIDDWLLKESVGSFLLGHSAFSFSDGGHAAQLRSATVEAQG